MSEFAKKAVELCTTAGSKILLAIVVFIVGRFVIKKIMNMLESGKTVNKVGQLEPTVKSFTLNFVKILLNVILVLSIISILGIPMASVVTVLATAGLAVGMSLQGALSNLAGGIMLLIFRPFNVGDYVATSGEEGIVKEIALFYTVLTTVDNKRVIIPNGALMNANVTNFSAEPYRRVDLAFACAKGEDVSKITGIMKDVMAKNPKVVNTPAAPFAALTGGTNESMEFTVRAWTETANYWDVFFALTEDITNALGAAGITAPAMRVITEQK